MKKENDGDLVEAEVVSAVVRRIVTREEFGGKSHPRILVQFQLTILRIGRKRKFVG